MADYLICSYQVAFVQAVEQATKALGISLLTFAGRRLGESKPDWATQSRIYELISPDSVDAIIMLSGPVGMHIGAQKLANFCRRYQPLPICSAGFALPGIPSIVVSNRQATRVAVQHLIVQHDARRIAYIRGPSDNDEAVERYQGYIDALTEHGLPIDDRLVVDGEFNVATGAQATRELLSRGVVFDGLAAANDYMALAAYEVLNEAGLRVPEDVLVVGFDDAPYARYAIPPLTTVRQPLERLARIAVDWTALALDGKTLPALQAVDVELVARLSCGCGRTDRKIVQRGGSQRTIVDLGARVTEDRPDLARLLQRQVGIPRGALNQWAERLTFALEDELTRTPGRLLAELHALLLEAAPYPDYVDELVKAIALLRLELQRVALDCEASLQLEQLWNLAHNAVSNAATNAQGRQGLAMTVVLEAINNGFAGVVTAMSRPKLLSETAAMLPQVNIRNASISLFEDGAMETLVPFLVLRASSEEPAGPAKAFPVRQLVPRGFLPAERHSHVILSLSFEQDWFGLFVCEQSTHEAVYGILRDNVSASLKSCELYRDALRQSALREQVEREHLHSEARLAAKIQTAILPRHSNIRGLQIAAQMIPAANVGGDYYDIIPCDHGGWLGIGDVTGHGLLSGLIMMMIQAMVHSLIRSNPMLPPSHHLIVLNEALHDNLRHRLTLDEHATLTLIHYEDSGTLTFAGAHEDLIIYRTATRRCECVNAPGVWVGAIDDVSPHMADASTRLERGDLLVLYTDGVTEAMNAHREQFGLARLCRVVEASAHLDVSAIVDNITNDVAQWHTAQTDDVTVVVARYVGT